MSIPTVYSDLSARSGRSGAAAVASAVQAASASTGVDFSYLMEKAAVESDYQSDLKASTSSATGLYQFLEGTWLEALKSHGAEHGYGAFANAIQRSDSGRLTVPDPDQRRQIMELRKDPKASALMVAEMTKDNAQYLQQHVGGTIGKTELYMAHFLGQAGATKFLNALHANPNQAGRDLFPEAAASNRGVFYDRTTGQPTSLSQIYQRFAGKFDQQGGSVVGSAGAGWAALDPTRSFNGSPLAGQMISGDTVLALAALETPLDQRPEDGRTAYGSRKMGAALQTGAAAGNGFSGSTSAAGGERTQSGQGRHGHGTLGSIRSSLGMWSGQAAAS